MTEAAREIPDKEGEGQAFPSFAHMQDSLAIAEHLSGEEILQRLQRMPGITPAQKLSRAGVCYEYALATPGTDGDEYYFSWARSDLKQAIQAFDPSSRSLTLVNSQLLLAYEPIFRERANDNFAPVAAAAQLQEKIGEITLNFLGERELTEDDHGPLSELVALYHMLQAGLLPYITVRREENNIIAYDNHDYYTLHPCQQNRVRKTPVSVKFREGGRNPLMVKLSMGRMALAAAKRVPGYDKGVLGRGKAGNAAALRLAADIAVCHSGGETLSPEDNALLLTLAADVRRPIDAFAERAPAVDYASNAAAIQAEITEREAQRATRQAAWLHQQ